MFGANVNTFSKVLCAGLLVASGALILDNYRNHTQKVYAQAIAEDQLIAGVVGSLANPSQWSMEGSKWTTKRGLLIWGKLGGEDVKFYCSPNEALDGYFRCDIAEVNGETTIK